jgi:hypothetical protein
VTVVARLSPLGILRERRVQRDSEGATLTTWDEEDFSGGTWSYAAPAGREVDEAALMADLETLPEATHDVPIPRVVLPADLRAAGWRTTGLGRCALRVSGGAGVAGQAPDAELRVVTTPAGVTLIEVSDDHWVGRGRARDQLQVYLRTQPPTPVITLHLADAAGALVSDEPSRGIRVERAIEPIPGRPPSVRFRIPEVAASALAVVYTDVDPGRPGAGRRLATTTLRAGRPVGFNEFRDLGEACEVRDRQLDPRRQEDAEPDPSRRDEAFIPMDL